jgi:ribose 5-phosphate isomerase B
MFFPFFSSPKGDTIWEKCFSGIMKVYLGTDHGGYEQKESIKLFLDSLGVEYEDLGAYSEQSVDYPSFGKKVAEAVKESRGSCGIVFCGTGIGISIAANKVSGVRAALCTTPTHARLARQHNNANVLALGGRMTGIELAKDIVQTFLESSFKGGRHERRVGQISAIEQGE